MRAFLIDDEKMYFKLLNAPLKKAGHKLGYASSGEQGLASIAAFDPDVIILDIMLPDISGFDILVRLRKDPHFSHVPVIFATSQDELQSKLKAFELGAEDYLTKPFKAEELIARLGILARRREILKAVESATTPQGAELSPVIAIHSLRGGVGCTSLSINLALAYHQIWNRSALVVDTVLTAGQVAMFLNMSPRVTWEDISTLPLAELDDQTLQRFVHIHKSGIHCLTAPKTPIPFERFADYFGDVLTYFRRKDHFIVIDTPHDFSDVSIKALDAADTILVVMTPEMGSLRSVICALATYDRLGYQMEKVKIVVNTINADTGLKISQVEKALGCEISLALPYSQEVGQAINYGDPFLLANPKSAISQQVETLAYNLSQEILRNIPPAAPTEAWKRVAHKTTPR
ncbi:MAG: response regulator [Chloroflexi bacterium]|nr:response regulator [Chloroflexota bacterium]